MSPKAKEMKASPQVQKNVAPAPEESDDDAESTEQVQVFPENIQKRVNALKNIHMEVQKIEQDMHTKLFLLEAEFHKKLTGLLAKRNEVIVGSRDPTDDESKFKLKDTDEDPQTIPADGTKGIPKFWLTVLTNCIQMLDWIEPHDHEALESLVDIRAVYSEKPLGFTIEFEFAENPFFANKILTRSYEFDENVAREDLYINTGLSPKLTTGCKIEWKDGKNLTKKQNVTVQRNKKTGERRKITQEVDQDSFFKFFVPDVTDLANLLKSESHEDAEAADENFEKVQRAEAEYELASYLRTRVIPRAVLLFTGEEEAEMYGDDEDDFDDEDDDDDEDDEEGGGDHGEPEDESDESEDGGHHGHHHGKKGGVNGKCGKRHPKGPHAH